MGMEGKYGYSTVEGGFPLIINCPTCKKYLTKIIISNRCIIDFKIECTDCGNVCKGDKLWAEISDKEPPQKEDVIG